MQFAITLMEAVRFLADHAPGVRNSNGTPLLAISARASSLLMQHVTESPARVQIAALLFPFFSDHLHPEQIQEVFGEKTVSLLTGAGNDELLAVKPLQRLVPEKDKQFIQNCRAIRLATQLALMLYADAIEEKRQLEKVVADYSHTEPGLARLISSELAEAR